MKGRFWQNSWDEPALLWYLWLIFGLVIACHPASAAGDVNSLTKDLGSSNHETHVKAVKELKEIGPVVAPQLIATIKDKSTNRDVRQIAMSVLSEIGTSNDDSLPFFIEALKDDDKTVQEMALYALGKMKSPEGIKAYESHLQERHDEDVKQALAEWKRDFPDSYDYEGVPLSLLAETYHPELRVRYTIVHQPKDFDEKIYLRRLITEYPQSKVAPLAAFYLYTWEHNYDALIKDWGNEKIPSAADGFRDVWGHYPIPGVRIAPIAQFYLAEKASSEDAWRKVLEYYPSRLESSPSILDEEYKRIILIAYFELLEKYDSANNVPMAVKLEDEILKISSHKYGNNFGKNSYAEVYLRKASRLASKKDYAKAEEYLDKVITDYGSEYWGYHGGIGDIYATSAVYEMNALPAENRVRLLGKLLKNPPQELDTCWANLILIGSLAEEGKDRNAEELLKALYEKYPDGVIEIIEGPYRGKTVGEWFSKEKTNRINHYYRSLKSASKKAK